MSSPIKSSDLYKVLDLLLGRLDPTEDTEALDAAEEAYCKEAEILQEYKCSVACLIKAIEAFVLEVARDYINNRSKDAKL